MNGAIAEAQGYNQALASGEIGIQAPGKVTATGPDYITFDSGNGVINVWDAKYSSTGNWPNSANGFGSNAWLNETLSLAINYGEGAQLLVTPEQKDNYVDAIYYNKPLNSNLSGLLDAITFVTLQPEFKIASPLVLELDSALNDARAAGVAASATDLTIAQKVLTVTAETSPEVSAEIAADVSKLNAATQATDANAVYLSVNSEGVVQYVGITNNFARREAEQLIERGINIEPLMQGLSRDDARAVEQTLIELYGLGKDGAFL